MAKQVKKVTERATDKAITLFVIGFIAEFYLLMIDKFYINNGTVNQVLAVIRYLQIAAYVGLALFIFGMIAFYFVKNKPKLNRLGVWGVGIGGFFAISSVVLLKFPGLIPALNVTVPVLMLLGIAYLLYERTFFAEALGLTGALYATVFLHRGATNHVKIGAAVVMAAIVALIVLSAIAKAHKGKLGKLRIFPKESEYPLLFTVLTICILAVLCAFLFPVAAYYLIWTLAIITFLLSVYYTVRIL